MPSRSSASSHFLASRLVHTVCASRMRLGTDSSPVPNTDPGRAFFPFPSCAATTCGRHGTDGQGLASCPIIPPSSGSARHVTFANDRLRHIPHAAPLPSSPDRKPSSPDNVIEHPSHLPSRQTRHKSQGPRAKKATAEILPRPLFLDWNLFGPQLFVFRYF